MRALLITAALLTSAPAMAGQERCETNAAGFETCYDARGAITMVTPPQYPARYRYVEDEAPRREDATGPMYFGNQGCVWNSGNNIYGRC